MWAGMWVTPCLSTAPPSLPPPQEESMIEGKDSTPGQQAISLSWTLYTTGGEGHCCLILLLLLLLLCG